MRVNSYKYVQYLEQSLSPVLSVCSHVQVTMLLQRGEQQRRGHGDRAHEPARLVQIRDLEPVAEVPRKMSAERTRFSKDYRWCKDRGRT